MKLYVYVQFNNIIYSFGLLENSDSSRISIPNEFIIDVFKIHNHRYEFKAFFYRSKNIYSISCYFTKLELYSAIQSLLKQELYNVEQF